jgi:uncharacterized glyoxalase superfamily protein PhnB
VNEESESESRDAGLPAETEAAPGAVDEGMLRELRKLLDLEDSVMTEAEREHGHSLRFTPGLHSFYGIVPVFLVDDIDSTCRYYETVLGFQINFTYGNPPTFACVSRDTAMINFNLATPPGSRNSAAASGAEALWDAYVLASHLDEVCEELRHRGARIIAEPVSRDYGMREFQVEDCNGYRLVIADGVFG